MKRLASCILICTLFLSCVHSAVSAEHAISSKELVSGSYRFVLREDGTAEITGYSGSETELTVPQALGGIAVTAIGEAAFQANDTLMEVTVPEGITALGDYAFQRCVSLSSVSLPASLKEVGLNPFAGCEALAAIGISEGNTSLKTADSVLFSLEDRRLIWYSMLKERGAYSVPAGTRIIGASAFYQCENITALVLPDRGADAVGLTAVGSRAFYQCENLR